MDSRENDFFLKKNMKSSFLDKLSNMTGFLYLRLTVGKIVINIIINRVIMLELILVNRFRASRQ